MPRPSCNQPPSHNTINKPFVDHNHLSKNCFYKLPSFIIRIDGALFIFHFAKKSPQDFMYLADNREDSEFLVNGNSQQFTFDIENILGNVGELVGFVA